MKKWQLKWEKRFEIGHERIDFEHMIFFDLIMTLEQCIQSDGDPERAKRTINEIVKYARFHFISEENIMEDVGYPGLADHRELHVELIDKLHNQLAVGDLQTLLTFLHEWFIKHTLEEEQEIVNHVAASK